jgi:hypothetical protein
MRIIVCLLLALLFSTPAYSQNVLERAQKVFQVPSSYQVKIDYTTGTNPIYIGYADKGLATSVAHWFILKLTWDANNNVTAIQSVNDVTWDDRATATYS